MIHIIAENYLYMWVSINGESPIAGWFIRENPTNMDDNWGYPYFRKPSYHIYIYIYIYICHPDIYMRKIHGLGDQSEKLGCTSQNN